MFCSECGKNLESSAKFCSGCGKKASSAAGLSAASLSVTAPDARANSPTVISLIADSKFIFASSKMGGRIGIKVRRSIILDERQELKIEGNVSASVSTAAETRHGSVTDTAWSTVNNDVNLSVQLKSSTAYSYWIRWDDNVEQLFTMPMSCRAGQEVFHVYALRENPGPEDTIPSLHVAMMGGKPQKIMFFKDRTPTSNNGNEIIFVFNTASGESVSFVREWVMNDAHPEVKKCIDMKPIKVFGKTLFPNVVEANRKIAQTVEDAISEIEQRVKELIESALKIRV